MILTIFGATGMVGKQLVKQALYNGHTVRAFGRNVFTAQLPNNPQLSLVQGALFSEEQVYDAVSGADAVLSAIGGGFDGTDKARSLGMKNIVEQMEKAAVKRMVALGGMGSLQGEDGKLIMESPDFPPQYLPVSREHFAAWEFLAASSLEWTFVCSPDIIDQEATGDFVTASNSVPTPNLGKINAGDLALFMLAEVNKKDFLRQKVGISAL